MRSMCNPASLAQRLAVRQLVPLLGGVRPGHGHLHVLRQGGLLPLRGAGGPGLRQGGQLGGQPLLLHQHQVVSSQHKFFMRVKSLDFIVIKRRGFVVDNKF